MKKLNWSSTNTGSPSPWL